MATGTIEQLNFEIILHDDKFNAQIAKDKEAAKKLNMTLSQYLTAKKKEAAVIAQVEKARLQHERVLRSENAQYKTQSTLLRQLGTLAGAYFSVRGAERFVRSLVDITGEFEKQKMALTSMLQSSEASDRIFNEYRQLALKSPYTFQDFTKFGKQLLAFNIPQEELVNTTKMLADVAAGLGVDMGRIILAYGQIKSAGVLKGTELRQLTEAGVPILDSLAKQIEETTGKAVKLGDVFGMISKKQIPFEMVEEAFRRMTSEGGKFYNMQEVLVETLWGKIGKLKDVWQQTLYDFGSESSINKFLKGSVDLVTQLVTHLDSIGKVLAPIIAGFGAYGAALAAVAVGQKALDLLNFIKALKGVAAGSKAAASALTMMGGAGKAAAVSLGAIAVLGVAIYEIAKAVKKHNEEANRMNVILKENDKALNDEKEKLDELNMKLKLNKKGTDEWNNAKKQAVSQYGQYFNKLDDEITKVGDLSTAYDTLTTAIEDSVRARQVSDFMAKERERIDSLNNDRLEGIRKAVYGKFRRDEAFEIMNEVERVLNFGGVYGNLSEKVQKQIGEYKIGFRGGISGRVNELLMTNRDEMKEYKRGLKALVVEYGLQGTEFDPDFNGPMPMKKTPEPTNTNAKPGTTPKDDQEIARIRREIAQIEEYKKAYNDFTELVGEDMAKGLLEEAFDKPFEDFDFDKQIGDLLKQLSGLGDEGREAAESIETSLGRDKASKIKKRLEADKKATEEAKKALEEYLETLAKWAAADKSREGTGVEYKISKAIADYNTATANADRQFEKTIKQAEKAGQKNPTEITKAAVLLARDRMGALATMENAINGMAEDIFREALNGYDLTNWNDKTLGQILEIKHTIEGIELPDWVVKALEKYPKLLEALKKHLAELKSDYLNNTVNPERDKAIGEVARFAAKGVTSLADAFISLKEATGDLRLRETASAIGEIGSLVNDLSSAYKEFGGSEGNGGFNAMMILFAIKANLKVLQLAAEDYARDLREYEAVMNARNAGRMQDTETGSFFGTSTTSLINSRIKQIERIKESMAAYKDAVDSFQVTTIHYDIWKKIFGWMNNENWRNGELLPDVTSSLKGIADSLGLALYDENGNLNAESLKYIRDAYEGLSEEQTKWLNQAIADSEDYAAALADIKDALQDVYGDIASSAADKIIDQWVSAGDAALDYADILDDVARRYAKMLLESAILDQVLNKEEADKVAAQFLSGDTEGAMATIAEDMQKIAGMEPLFASIMDVFDPYLNKEGSEDTLANGINKQLVEGNSSLLASYINAMRADLSAQRADVSGIRGDVSAILGGIGVLPTLNDYLAQVAADAHDTAQSNRQILTEIQSVITSASGRRAIAVDVQ